MSLMISALQKTTQQHNNTTTQQHNNTTTQQPRRPRKPQALWRWWCPHPCQENNYDGGSGEVCNVRCEDRRGARSLSVFCQRLVKDIRDIFFYVIDIPYSTRTIRGTNLIQRCQWDHLLEGNLKGVCVWAAGLNPSIVSTDGLLCQFCIGCSLSLNYNGTKLCVIRDIFGPSYSFWLVLQVHISMYNQNLFPARTKN